MKVQNLLLASCCFFLFLSSSCKDDEGLVGKTTSVTLNFTAKYGDEPFVLLTDEFAYPNGSGGMNMIRFQEELGIFISNIELLQAEGSDRQELKEITYLDFGANSSPTNAEIPLSLTFTNVPVGDYKGIKFNLGVPADLNAESPQAFGADHPLSDAALHWSGWGSYTFLRLDGCYDRDGAGLGTTCNTANGDNSVFTIHAGGDSAYRDMDAFIRNFTLTESAPGVFNFEIDVAEILGVNSDLIELGNGPSLHTNDINSPEVIALINRIMDNTATRAVTLKN